MADRTIESRIVGAMLGLACGDALGAPAEFHDQAYIRQRWGTLTEMVGGGVWDPGERTARKLLNLRRHLPVYAKRGLPPLNFDWVTERILAGRQLLTARDIETLADLGITHVLDLNEPLD